MTSVLIQIKGSGGNVHYIQVHTRPAAALP